MCNGVDRLKHSELHDRRVARLGEGALVVRDGRIYGDCIPVQNDISPCAYRSKQQTEQQPA